MPNVIIEAAVLKKPIISTNCPTGPKEILGNGKGGYMYKIGDYLKLSKIIKRYSNNKKEFNKKKNYLYKSLDRFNYKKNLKSYYNLINRHLN